MLVVAVAWTLVSCGGRKAEPIPPVPAPDPYVITSGDTLDIVVWRETQLSGPVQVRSDGMITLALLGDVQASGLTPEQLGENIRQGLLRYVDAPNVVVRLATSSRRYFVIGNVSNPGMFELRPNQTFLQAIAVSGGFTPFASRGNVRIIRPGSNSGPIEPDYTAIINGQAPDVVLQNNDTIVVP
jgi:polysaccharide export outer membrane protein